MISIHRSLAGPDGELSGGIRDGKRISIHRSLAGPDLVPAVSSPPQDAFQSTGPLRDPTFTGTGYRSCNQDFNPQVPCGTRPDTSAMSDDEIKFQSTGPLRDPTRRRMERRGKQHISIHRSLAGPDSLRALAIVLMSYFNPQVPCGTRPATETVWWTMPNFNPQVPCGTRPPSGLR